MKRMRFLTHFVIFALSMSLISTVSAETRIETPIAAGVQLLKISKESKDGKPLTINIVKIDRSATNISFKTLKGKDHVVGTESPRTMGERLNLKNGEVLATINGDFYMMDDPLAGVPCGTIVRDGEFICTPTGWPSLGFDKDGTPRVAAVSYSGNLQIGDKSLPITQVNRPHDNNELALLTASFGPTSLNTKPGTDVIVKNIKPELPFRAGVKYTGTVTKVFSEVTDNVIPQDAVVFSGIGTSSQFLQANVSEGSIVNFSMDFDHDWNKITESLGGWPILLHNGQLQAVERDEYLTHRRHPRSAVGWNDKYIYVVAIDGSGSINSIGMDMAELAQFMQELGCNEAMNMDGGGSTMLAIRGNVIDRPSDGLDRRVSNGWAVINTAANSALKSLQVYPENMSMLAGSQIQLRVIGMDSDGSPVQVNPADVKWSLEGVEASSSMADPDSKIDSNRHTGLVKGEIGSIDEKGLFTSAMIFRSGQITAKVGDVSGAAIVNIWDKPAQIFIMPANQVLKPKQTVQFTIFATDRTGQPMVVDSSQVKWSVKNGKITSGGILTAPKKGHSIVSATVNGVYVSVEFEVSK